MSRPDHASCVFTDPPSLSIGVGGCCDSLTAHAQAAPAAIVTCFVPAAVATCGGAMDTFVTGGAGVTLTARVYNSVAPSLSCSPAATVAAADTTLGSPQLESTIEQLLLCSSRSAVDRRTGDSCASAAAAALSEAIVTAVTTADCTVLDNDVSQSSSASDEILHTQNLTLDKSLIARDLFGEHLDDADTCCTAAHRSESTCEYDAPDQQLDKISRQNVTSDDISATAYDVCSTSLTVASAASLRSSTVLQLPPTCSGRETAAAAAWECGEPTASVPVGVRYQASVPALLPRSHAACAACRPVWSCHRVSEATVVEYLRRVAAVRPTAAGHRSPPPPPASAPAAAVAQNADKKCDSSIVRDFTPLAPSSADALVTSTRTTVGRVSDLWRACPDDERALQTLCEHDYDVESAVAAAALTVAACSHTDGRFSQSDVANFEAGLGLFGKNFDRIRHFKLPQRSVAELVGFYYEWKRQRSPWSHRYRQLLPKHGRRRAVMRYTSSENLITNQQPASAQHDSHAPVAPSTDDVSSANDSPSICTTDWPVEFPADMRALLL